MADTAEIIIDLQHNVADFNKALKALTGQLTGATDKTDKLKSSTDKLAKDQIKVAAATRESKKAAKEYSDETEKASKKTSIFSSKLGDVISNITTGQLAILGITGGIGGMISTAHSLNQQLSAQADGLTRLTTQTGSTAMAMNTLYSASGTSLAGLTSLQSGMKALGDTGVALGSTFTKLTSMTGDLEQMTGIASDAWGTFLGQLQVNYSGSIKQLKDLTSSMIATGLNGSELEIVLKNVQDGIKSVGFLSGDSIKDVQGLTNSIGRATAVMKRMGIDAQTSGEFITGMLNPENFEKNLQLMGRLGLSVKDYLDALSSGEGKEAFTDKMLKNLPQLAKQLQSIPDPLQKFNLLKDMGLDPKIAAKFAKSTGADIEKISAELKEAQKGQVAYDKKKSEAKASAEKYQDSLDAFKRKALGPLMDFVSNMMGPWMTILGSLAGSVSKILGGILKIIGPSLITFGNSLAEAVKLFDQGNIDGFANSLGKAVGKFMAAAEPMLIQFFKVLVPVLGTVLKTVLKAAFAGFVELIKESPLIAGLLGAKVLGGGSILKGGERAVGGAKWAGKKVMGSAAGKALGPMLGNVAKFAGPIGVAIGAVMGGFDALSHSAEYFADTMTKAQQKHLEFAQSFSKNFDETFDEDRYDKLTKMKGKLSEADKKELDAMNNKLLARKGAENRIKGATTTGQDAASFTAGAATLGIAPLIDSVFGTQVTGKLAKNIYSMGESFSAMDDKMGGALSATIPFVGSIRSIIENWDEIGTWAQVFWFKLKKIPQGLADVVRDTWNAWVEFNMWLQGIGEDIFNGIMSPIETAKKALASFKEMDIGAIFNAMKMKVMAFFQWLSAKFASSWADLKNLFGGDEKLKALAAAGKSIKIDGETGDTLLNAIAAGTTKKLTDVRDASLKGVEKTEDRNAIYEFYNEQREAQINAAKAEQALRKAEKESRKLQEDANKNLRGINGGIKELNEKDTTPTIQALSLEGLSVFGIGKMSEL